MSAKRILKYNLNKPLDQRITLGQAKRMARQTVIMARIHSDIAPKLARLRETDAKLTSIGSMGGGYV